MNSAVEILSPDKFGLSSVREIVESREHALSETRMTAIDCIDDLVSDEYKPRIVSNVTFMLTLWLLRYLDESVLTSKFINGQRDILTSELDVFADEDIEDYCHRMGMHLDFDVEREIFSVPFDTFIRNNTRISGEKYRLSYQPVNKGTVYANRDVVIKIAREFFVKSAFRTVENISMNDVVDVFEPYADFISSMRILYDQLKSSRKVDLGAVDSTKFPPCIREYISEMKSGVNLPHLARFTLVSFLHKTGMTSGEIIELFKTAPDYNEKMTVYQVNHVTGEISGTEYSPPKCAVLKSNHLCYMGEDTLCNQEWLRHPLQYYQIKKKHSK